MVLLLGFGRRPLLPPQRRPPPVVALIAPTTPTRALLPYTSLVAAPSQDPRHELGHGVTGSRPRLELSHSPRRGGRAVRQLGGQAAPQPPHELSHGSQRGDRARGQPWIHRKLGYQTMLGNCAKEEEDATMDDA